MQEIGRGATGVVFVVDEDRVAKRSLDAFQCKTYEHQYTRHSDAYKCVEINLPAAYRGVIRVPEVFNFEKDGDTCQYVMERVFSPRADAKMVHPMLNLENYNEQPIEGRGVYLSSGYVADLIAQYDMEIENLSFYLGVALGVLQYGCMQTAKDVEYIIGLNKFDRLMLYVLDFDQSETWSPDDDIDDITERLAEPLWLEDYFPLDNELLMQHFSDGYQETAENFGYGGVAGLVLEEALGED